jgi:hypothetical protein
MIKSELVNRIAGQNPHLYQRDMPLDPATTSPPAFKVPNAAALFRGQAETASLESVSRASARAYLRPLPSHPNLPAEMGHKPPPKPPAKALIALLASRKTKFEKIVVEVVAGEIVALAARTFVAAVRLGLAPRFKVPTLRSILFRQPQ